jgi:hypothetical protein
MNKKDYSEYLKKYREKHKHKCLDCEKLVSDPRSLRCHSCSIKKHYQEHKEYHRGKNAPNFKDGRCSEKHFCLECKKEIGYNAWFYGTKKCKKHSKKLKEKNRCVGCNRLISRVSKRCRKCNAKEQSKRIIGTNNPNYKENSYFKCIDCGIDLKYQTKRCLKCFKKFNRGIHHHNFGKITKPHFVRYKNTMMRSSWEVAYAKYLDRQSIKWQYETKVFDLGETTYRPDFYLPELNKYVEIKGYKSEIFKNKFKEFRKRYNNVNIDILEKKDLEKLKII